MVMGINRPRRPTILPVPRPMLISIIQIRPLVKGAWRRGKPLKLRADSMRTIASRITQLMMVCGHGAFLMPRAQASRLRTRETARKPMRATKKSCRANKTTSTLGRATSPWRWALELTQTRLGLFEGCGGAVSLGGDASDLFALVAIAVASLRGFVFPLISTVFDFGELAHHVRSCQPPWPQAMGVVSG